MNNYEVIKFNPYEVSFYKKENKYYITVIFFKFKKNNEKIIKKQHKCIAHENVFDSFLSDFDYITPENCILHCEDGPAEINYNDSLEIEYEAFYFDGYLHNTNGAALLHNKYDTNLNSYVKQKEYYIKNKHIKVSSDEEFKKYLKLQNIK